MACAKKVFKVGLVGCGGRGCQWRGGVCGQMVDGKWRVRRAIDAIGHNGWISIEESGWTDAEYSGIMDRFFAGGL